MCNRNQVWVLGTQNKVQFRYRYQSRNFFFRNRNSFFSNNFMLQNVCWKSSQKYSKYPIIYLANLSNWTQNLGYVGKKTLPGVCSLWLGGHGGRTNINWLCVKLTADTPQSMGNGSQKSEGNHLAEVSNSKKWLTHSKNSFLIPTKNSNDKAY